MRIKLDITTYRDTEEPPRYYRTKNTKLKSKEVMDKINAFHDYLIGVIS